MQLKQLTSYPRPVETYEDALRRVQVLKERDTVAINPLSHSQCLAHGEKTRYAVVWLHGYTSSPAQYSVLAQRCFDQGHNILVPRCPHHGLSDRMTAETSLLTAEKLIAYADEAVNIACGLGEKVIVGGLSMGGVITAWLAQHRPDIHLALIISPAFGAYTIPARLTRWATQFLLVSPDHFRWWDSKAKAKITGATHGYPRHSMRGLAQIFRLGFAVQQLARHSKPSARQVWVITNQNDRAVNNTLTAQLVQYWQHSGADNLHTYVFPTDLNLPHDLIEPENPYQKIDQVYPILAGIVQNTP